MATPQTGKPIQLGNSDQLAGLNQMLSALFGTGRTETASANTAPMEQLFAQLQQTNYQPLLDSIFAQAGGAIPGMQIAHANAVGARSGSNSAVQANLDRLRQQTTLLGQQQLVQQQQANQELQAQVANNIAQNTRSVKEETPGKAKELAGLLALTQGALKLTGAKDLEELWNKVGGKDTKANPTGTTGGLSSNTINSLPTPMASQRAITSAMRPTDYSLGGAANMSAGALSQSGGDSGLSLGGGVDYSFDLSPFIGGGGGLKAPTVPMDYNIGSFDYSLVPDNFSSGGLQAPSNFDFGLNFGV